MSSKKRKRLILEALAGLDGEASTRQIAEKLGLNVNGVSQSLGAMQEVECIEVNAGDSKWRLVTL